MNSLLLRQFKSKLLNFTNLLLNIRKIDFSWRINIIFPLLIRWGNRWPLIIFYDNIIMHTIILILFISTQTEVCEQILGRLVQSETISSRIYIFLLSSLFLNKFHFLLKDGFSPVDLIVKRSQNNFFLVYKRIYPLFFELLSEIPHLHHILVQLIFLSQKLFQLLLLAVKINLIFEIHLI